MIGKIKKLKNTSNEYMYPITVGDAVYVESNKTLTQKLSELSSGSGAVGTTEIIYYNLFDKTRVVNGQYHDSSTGNIIAGGIETHRIEVKPGYNYTFNRGDTITSQYSFYDASEVYVSGGSALAAKAPNNARYLYVRIWSSAMIDKFMVLESGYRFNSTTDYKPHKKSIIDSNLLNGYYRSQWFNQVWWVLGDSISTGMGEGEGASNAYASKPYHYLLSTERFIHVQNQAVSGYTIGQIYDNVIVNMPPTEYAPKLITIMAGTNDHGFNVPVGTITDDSVTGTTFYSRYRKSIEFLQNRYPMTTIGLITPIRRYNASGTNGDYTNALGSKVIDYCNAVKSIGDYYSLPVLDLYSNLGFSPYNPTQNTNFFVNGDGTHPNNEGQKRMAARVGDFIERI